jgi:hypothetical protein
MVSAVTEQVSVDISWLTDGVSCLLVVSAYPFLMDGQKILEPELMVV